MTFAFSRTAATLCAGLLFFGAGSVASAQKNASNPSGSGEGKPSVTGGSESTTKLTGNNNYVIGLLYDTANAGINKDEQSARAFLKSKNASELIPFIESFQTIQKARIDPKKSIFQDQGVFDLIQSRRGEADFMATSIMCMRYFNGKTFNMTEKLDAAFHPRLESPSNFQRAALAMAYSLDFTSVSFTTEMLSETEKHRKDWAANGLTPPLIVQTYKNATGPNLQKVLAIFFPKEVPIAPTGPQNRPN